ncbi:MAG: hypothetical protein K9N35_10460 [Candidatus Marinimicrobia bacterium]|nr:hypothetical protein [Candidatus Neomarinimicrobiota bacterium]
MKRFPKILYGLGVLCLGIFLSISLINKATSHDTAHVEVAPADTLFPDYVKMFNTYYKQFENRKGHFHQTAERTMLPMEKQENCLTCHSLWPHQKDNRTRAFNNQHSRYMTCMVCHIDEQVGRPVKFEWYDFGVDNSITREGPFGIERIADKGLSAEENFITRIVPIIVDGDIKSRLFATYETPVYRQFREDSRAGVTVNAQEVRKQAEALLGKTPLTCSQCHAEASQFPWAELGFAGMRADEMLHSAVVGMVEKYENFYFPAVFE